jgi:hypothetical protein
MHTLNQLTIVAAWMLTLLTHETHSALQSKQEKAPPVSMQEAIQKSYGTRGLNTLRQISQTIEEFNKTSVIQYEPSKQLFKITSSTDISPEALQEAFDKNTYEVWEPKITRERSSSGNLHIKFVCATEVPYRELYSKVNKPSLPKLPSEYYLKNEVAEALQSEAVFTIESDPKPILAAYRCGPCVALAGWEPKNKAGFLVHFASAGEVEQFKDVFTDHFNELITDPSTQPIQLHARGGQKSLSEAIINAITDWVQTKDNKFSMIIASAAILKTGLGDSENLALDTRSGNIYSYSPLKNPTRRSITKLHEKVALLSVLQPNITIAYKGKAELDFDQIFQFSASVLLHNQFSLVQ